MDDEAEVLAEDDMMGDGGRSGGPPGADDSDEEEEVMYSEQLRAERKDDLDESVRAKMESEIDPLIWQTELERVTPHLKVKTSHGGKEWRAHIAQTKKHGAIVESILPDSRKKLAMISDAIKMSLERLQGKERYLNSHFDSMVQEYREVQDRLEVGAGAPRVRGRVCEQVSEQPAGHCGAPGGGQEPDGRAKRQHDRYEPGRPH